MCSLDAAERFRSAGDESDHLVLSAAPETPSRSKEAVTSVSSRPVSERLLSHLRRLSADILADYEDAVLSGTPEAVAAYREDFVREIIGRFFPRTYRMAKGAIFDSYGERSASIDCVVCAPNHPLLVDSAGRLVTLLADGVHCAIELKPDLRDMPPDFGESRQRTPEIIRGLEQARSVKRLRRRRRELTMPARSPGFADYRQRVPTHILSCEPVDIGALGAYVARYYLAKAIPLAEQVDRIAVLNVGRLVLPKCQEHGYGPAPDGSGTDPVGHILVFPTAEDTLAKFLLEITSDEGPEMLMSGPVLPRYLEEQSWPRCSAFFRTVRPEPAPDAERST